MKWLTLRPGRRCSQRAAARLATSQQSAPRPKKRIVRQSFPEPVAPYRSGHAADERAGSGQLHRERQIGKHPDAATHDDEPEKGAKQQVQDRRHHTHPEPIVCHELPARRPVIRIAALLLCRTPVPVTGVGTLSEPSLSAVGGDSIMWRFGQDSAAAPVLSAMPTRFLTAPADCRRCCGQSACCKDRCRRGWASRRPRIRTTIPRSPHDASPAATRARHPP